MTPVLRLLPAVRRAEPGAAAAAPDCKHSGREGLMDLFVLLGKEAEGKSGGKGYAADD